MASTHKSRISSATFVTESDEETVLDIQPAALNTEKPEDVEKPIEDATSRGKKKSTEKKSEEGQEKGRGGSRTYNHLVCISYAILIICSFERHQ